MKTKLIILTFFALTSTVLTSNRRKEYNERMNELFLKLTKDPEFNALHGRQQIRVIFIIYDIMESYFKKIMFINDGAEDRENETARIKSQIVMIKRKKRSLKNTKLAHLAKLRKNL